MIETLDQTDQSAATAEGYLSKIEIAKRLNRTVRTVENWMRNGILPYYKFGRTVQFRWSEVQAHHRAKYRVGSRCDT